MGDHHRWRGDRGGSTEITEVDGADAGDAANGKIFSRLRISHMGVLRDVLGDRLPGLHQTAMTVDPELNRPCRLAEPVARCGCPARRHDDLVLGRLDAVHRAGHGGLDPEPGHPLVEGELAEGPTSWSAPNGPNEFLGHVTPFSQGELRSLSDPNRKYSVRPIHTSSITLSCTTGFSVLTVGPENPMLRSRSTVRITLRTKLTSPLPAVDPRRSRLVLVLLLE